MFQTPGAALQHFFPFAHGVRQERQHPEVPEVWLSRSCGTDRSIVANHSSRP
jgi:hypothetical protein